MLADEEEREEAVMTALAQQVSTFVRACEALHWALLEGHRLTMEERDMIQRTAVQLLMRAEGSTDTAASPQTSSHDKGWKRWDEQLEQDLHP